MEHPHSFGEWLRRRRKALDLTQDALASLVGCSKDLIVKIEGDARRPSREIAALLATHLRLADSEQADFIRAARAELTPDHLPPPTRSLPIPAFPAPQSLPTESVTPVYGNLPTSASSFLGRANTRADLTALLQQATVRLITLTGPGGIGKTRLALRVAEQHRESFPDGVWFVDLVPISDPQSAAAAVAQTLGVPEHAERTPQERLVAWLRSRQVLLLLDNYEHLLDAALLVSAILGAAPLVRVLVTSRVPLRLSGEWEYPVPPLDFGIADQEAAADDSWSGVSDNSTVRRLNTQTPPPDALLLFAERVCAVQPRFVLTPANVAVVAEICARLDGLPLAIELAAARIRLFTPEQLLDRLRQAALPVLIGGARDLPARQQTIHATILWSYQLLPPAQQRCLARLGVFVGGWTLEAAEAVVGGWGSGGADPGRTAPSQDTTASPDIPHVAMILEHLIEHSLVRRVETPGTPRFTMLETIREFALERLRENGEEQEMRRRQAAFFAGYAETFRQAYESGGDAMELLDMCDRDHSNVLAALQWIEAGIRQSPELAETGARIAAGLWNHWNTRHRSDFFYWIGRMLAPDWPAIASPARAAVLNVAWFIEPDRNAWAWSQALTEQGLALAQEFGDDVLIAEALNHLGEIADVREERALADGYFTDSLNQARQVGHLYRIGWALANLGKSALRQDRYDPALAYMQEARTAFERLSHTPGLVYTARVTGELWERLGDDRQAVNHYHIMQDLARRLKYDSILAAAHLLTGEALLRLHEYAAAMSEFTTAYRTIIDIMGEHLDELEEIHDWVTDDHRPSDDSEIVEEARNGYLQARAALQRSV